jgi:hypothetical protein
MVCRNLSSRKRVTRRSIHITLSFCICADQKGLAAQSTPLEFDRPALNLSKTFMATIRELTLRFPRPSPPLTKEKIAETRRFMERLGFTAEDLNYPDDIADVEETEEERDPWPLNSSDSDWVFDVPESDSYSDVSDSPPDDLPRPTTDISRVQPDLEERKKCLQCNERGRACMKKDFREAYAEFKKGMLGTGESEYSQLLTKYFNECLEIFCEQEELEGVFLKFYFYVGEIRARVLVPEYGCMRRVLLELIERSKKEGNRTEAIRLQKERIFVIMLGPQEEGQLYDEVPGDSRFGPDFRAIVALRDFMETESEGNAK